MIFLERGSVVREKEVLRIETCMNSILICREGKNLFDIPIDSIKRAWIESLFSFKKTFVLELKNHEQHAIKLPWFGRIKVNNLKTLKTNLNVG